MRGSLSLLFGASIACAALCVGGCSGPTSHIGSDAGPSDDAPGRCDPVRGACRVTLWCDDFVCEAVRLTDGEVRSEEPSWDFDVQAYLGRYLGLTASAGFCRFGASPGTSTAEFARLEDVPGDAATCSWAEGGNLLCGVNTATYDPTCVGDGLLVRDGAGTLHRLRVVEDGEDARGHFVTLEWSAIAP